ncbi:MAG TPA: hypothetical protein VNN07_19280 [Candidatus Tectomicrobia bacterium]|nr:hypothetical protein [Candidatus Tectomicrobia bacterium]
MSAAPARRLRAATLGGTGLAAHRARRWPTDRPKDPRLDKEKAEGERRTVDEALEQPAEERPGVTNRSAEEEAEQQSKLPPRGEAKKPSPGGHA